MRKVLFTLLGIYNATKLRQDHSHQHVTTRPPSFQRKPVQTTKLSEAVTRGHLSTHVSTNPRASRQCRQSMFTQLPMCACCGGVDCDAPGACCCSPPAEGEPGITW